MKESEVGSVGTRHSVMARAAPCELVPCTPGSPRRWRCSRFHCWSHFSAVARGQSPPDRLKPSNVISPESRLPHRRHRSSSPVFCNKQNLHCIMKPFHPGPRKTLLATSLMPCYVLRLRLIFRHRRSSGRSNPYPLSNISTSTCHGFFLRNLFAVLFLSFIASSGPYPLLLDIASAQEVTCTNEGAAARLPKSTPTPATPEAVDFTAAGHQARRKSRVARCAR